MPTIGTCNLCGGPVQTPDVWYGTQPPQPECAHCHAVPVSSYGPTIPMTKPGFRQPAYAIPTKENMRP